MTPKEQAEEIVEDCFRRFRKRYTLFQGYSFSHGIREMEESITKALEAAEKKGLDLGHAEGWAGQICHDVEHNDQLQKVSFNAGLKKAAEIANSGSYYRPEWEHHAINVQIAMAIEAEIK